MKVLKILKYIGISIAALALILTAVAYALPKAQTVEGSILINASPETIYPLISTPSEWEKWTIKNEMFQRSKVINKGPKTGLGSRQTWIGSKHPATMLTIIRSVKNREVHIRTTVQNSSLRGLQKMTLTTEKDGTQITIKDTWDLGNNPINRWAGLAFEYVVQPDIETNLKKLKSLAEAIEKESKIDKEES